MIDPHVQQWPRCSLTFLNPPNTVESTLPPSYLVGHKVLLFTAHQLDADHLKGDGIGAEVAESVKTIFKADNVPIEWEQIDVTGVETGDKHSEELFRESIASLKRNKLGLKGVDCQWQQAT